MYEFAKLTSLLLESPFYLHGAAQTSLISALPRYLDSSGLINLLILLVFGTLWSNIICAMLLARNLLLIRFIAFSTGG